MNTTTQAQFELRGWHVLLAMLAFFGAVIAVNTYFAVVALGTFPGEDVTHPYIQGLEYNRTIAEHRSQRALGWQAAVSMEAARDGAELIVDLRHRDGSPLDGAHVEGVLRWPADSHRDRTLTFQRERPGHYVAQLNTLSEGDWDLRARATQGENALDFEADLTWP